MSSVFFAGRLGLAVAQVLVMCARRFESGRSRPPLALCLLISGAAILAASLPARARLPRQASAATAGQRFASFKELAQKIHSQQAAPLVYRLFEEARSAGQDPDRGDPFFRALSFDGDFAV